MRKSKYTEEQIIGFLRQVEAGMSVKELCRKHGFSDASFYKWRAKFGGMDVSEARRLKELESENGKLKRLLAGKSPPKYLRHYILLRYCPPTSNSASVICPSEQTFTASISSAKTLPPLMAVCLSFASAAGAALACLVWNSARRFN